MEGNDFSYEAIQKGRNLYYQKQLANQIRNQMTEIVSLLTAALNIHLNIGQNLTMNTPHAFMSVETVSMESLPNKQIQQVGNAQIHLPSNFNANLSNNSTISHRVCFYLLFEKIIFDNLLFFSQSSSHLLRWEIQNLNQQQQIFQHQYHFQYSIKMEMKCLFTQMLIIQLKSLFQEIQI